MSWLLFQQRFIKAARNPQYHTVAASWPRGAGNTTIMGHLIAEAMNPYLPQFRAGAEPVLVASSIAQARQAFRVAREILSSALRISSGVGEGIYKPVVQGDWEFLPIGVGDSTLYKN